jgi:hemerythrin-like metal-binding protein
MAHAVRKELPSESVFRVVFGSTERDPAGVIPDAIYTLLPHLYVCAGMLTVVVLRNWMAAFSALVWFSAAAIVWVRRYRYRSPFERSGGRIDLPTVIDDDGPGDEVVQIFWQASFECGHAIIDAQHRRLFGLGNKLAKALMAKRQPGDIAWLLDELIDHVTDHFCTEEAVLVKAKHPVARKHQEIHRALLSKAAELRDRHRVGEIRTGELVGFIIHDVIIDHIAREAVEFSSLWSSRHSRMKRSRRVLR